MCNCYQSWGGITPPPPCPVHVVRATTNTIMWNGPICPACGPYLGSHSCLPAYVGKHRK